MVRRGVGEPIMQCHSPPDRRPEACVGFVLQVGRDSASCRLAVLVGLFDPDQMTTDEPLHSLASLIQQHGGRPSD